MFKPERHLASKLRCSLPRNFVVYICYVHFREKNINKLERKCDYSAKVATKWPRATDKIRYQFTELGILWVNKWHLTAIKVGRVRSVNGPALNTYSLLICPTSMRTARLCRGEPAHQALSYGPSINLELCNTMKMKLLSYESTKTHQTKAFLI